MIGKFLAGALVISAILAGAALYYFQVYAYYEEVPANTPGAEIHLVTVSGLSEPILIEDFQGIDATSSPIRYRACFTTPLSTGMMTETYVIYDRPEPLTGPPWFDCYNAIEIGEALESGEAIAYLGEENIEYGIDRVIAVFPDGRAFAWHQINACGEVVYDGQPAPDNCPTPPEGSQ